MCYRDMTFCGYYSDCLSGDHCPRALTDKVIKDAVVWFGSDSAPVSMFVSVPWCFEEKKSTQENTNEPQ